MIHSCSWGLICVNENRNITGTTFSGSTDSYGLSTVGALDRIVITLDGRLHRIVRCALRCLRAAVMLQRLIVRRGDWWIKRARDGADVVETGAELIARHHHTVRYAHCGYTRWLSLKIQIAHLMKNIIACVVRSDLTRINLAWLKEITNEV